MLITALGVPGSEGTENSVSLAFFDSPNLAQNAFYL